MINNYQNNYLKRKLFLILFIVALAVLFWSSAKLQAYFSNSVVMIAKYLEIHLYSGIVIFVLTSTLSAILSPFSSAPLIPIAVVIWGNTQTLILLLIGWILGGIISYFLGSSTGVSLIKKIVSFKKVEYYRQQISNQTNFIKVLIFRLALPTEIAGYILGTIKYNFSKYLLATTLAEIPFALILVYSSDAFVEANKTKFIFLTFLALALIGITRHLFKKLKPNH